ncbi:InlB B-repeat-containing protein [Candidatus Saccharibacteria bacterium]|nr:InlB B-repeat-containing protein [Candidatus Saccharibacteria bacterium]
MKNLLSLAVAAIVILPANAFAVDGEDDYANDHSEWCQSQDLSDPETETWTVHFNTYGGTAIPDTIAVAGCSLESMGKPPVDAEKENHTFYGWYHDEDFVRRYNPGSLPDSEAITEVDLYAEFVPNDMVINTASIDVSSPVAGREVTVTVITDGAVIEMQDPIPEITADETNYYVGYTGWRTTDDELFEGAFVEGQQYKASISLIAEEGYKFAPEFSATINGQPALLEEHSSQSDGNWIDIYIMMEAIGGEPYTATDEFGNTISFIDQEGHDFGNFTLQTISMSLTPAEIEEIDGVSVEEYNAVRTLILNAVGDNGEALAYLDINVCDASAPDGEEPYCAHEGPFTVKFAIPDGMTGYNIYKVMSADIDTSEEEVQMETGDPIICERDGDFITCVLPHLSGYILIGSNESAPNTGVVTNPHESIYESLILSVVIAVAFISAGIFLVTSDFRRR